MNGNDNKITLQIMATIANIIDAKDEYTKGHSQRVADYASILAEAMGYSEEEVRNVSYIGLLHDIGKIGIPDSILNKPGKLTETEFEIMKRHVDIGANILKDNNMVKNMNAGVKWHHERYDGTGYPDGLKGEEIPVIARIIGIADAFDAMTSNRVYRRRLSDEKVYDEIERCAGTQFDPEIAGIFLGLIKSGKITISMEEKRSCNQHLQIDKETVSLLQDIIDMNTARINRMEERDVLTDTYNKKGGDQRIEGVLKETDGLLVLLDITNISRINETYGFVEGDYVLKSAADVLMEFTEDIIVERYSGDQFLCFIPGITDYGEAESFVKDMYYLVINEIHKKQDYNIVDVCIGGVLSTMAGREIGKLTRAADKVLYYIKHLKGCGYKLYDEAEKNRDEAKRLSKIELEKLLQAIKKESEYDGTYKVDYPLFVKNFEFVRNICRRNKQDIQIILWTICPDGDKEVTIQERDKALQYLEMAISATLRKVDILLHYSSTQCIVFLMNLSHKQVELVTNRVITQFYKSYDGKNITLSFDVADLNGQ